MLGVLMLGVLGAHKLSGFVANKMSGFREPNSLASPKRMENHYRGLSDISIATTANPKIRRHYLRNANKFCSLFQI
jgi:hypothetical protein